MTAGTFAVYWTIHREELFNAEELAVKVNSVCDAFPNWRENTQEHRDLRRQLYVVLLKPVGKNRIKEFTDQLLRMRVRGLLRPVVHELVHLKVRNHGKLLKSLMYAYLPGWEEVEMERELGVLVEQQRGNGM